MAVRFAAFVTAIVLAGAAFAQVKRDEPCVVGPPINPMIFYIAHGPAGACGDGCSEWIAAEGAMQWDTFKRLIAIVDRYPERKLPLVMNVDERSSFYVALSLGRIARERGLDTTVGATRVHACNGKSQAECLTLKRSGGPLEATVDFTGMHCDMACVLTMVGGVQRYLPSDTQVRLSGWTIRSRFCTNIPEEWKEGLKGRFGEQIGRYLRQMEVDPAFPDLVEVAAKRESPTEVAPSDWRRLKLVNTP